MRGRITPRAILVAALVIFALYGWPGFIGWDTEASLMQERAGIYTDAHPPAIAALWRCCEVFVSGPLGMLAIQAVTLLLGLYRLFARSLAPRVAAVCAAAVFLYPPIAGVQALIVKDALMAGFLMLGIADLAAERGKAGLFWCFVASTMRWNALVATGPCIVLLLLPPGRGRWLRRMAISVAAWGGITYASMLVNGALTDQVVHQWHKSHAYMDIAGTLEYMPDTSDAEVRELLAGLPLRGDVALQARARAVYDGTDYRQLTPWLLDEPRTQADRDAVWAAWKRVVLGHPLAYLRYRWDNFRELVRIDKSPMFSQVYVWFTVIAAPESIEHLHYNAGPSRLQRYEFSAAIWVSNTWLYWPWVYALVAIALLWVCRRDRAMIAVLLSGLAYEATLFVLNPTGDFRYSAWMITTVMIAAVWRLGVAYQNHTRRPSAQRAASQDTIA